MRIYRHSALLAIAVAGCVLAEAADKPSRSTIEIVERLLTADKQTPSLYQPDPATPYAVAREFTFDDLLTVQPERLLQGVEYVLVKYGPPTEAEAQAAYIRSMNERLNALFEYYPLLARTPDDLDRLLRVIDDGRQPPVLRNFLMRRCVPGLAGRSAFGEYLQGMLQGDEEFDGRLSRIIENPTELPEVQAVAVEALGASIAAFYAHALAADPLVRDSVKQGNPAPSVQMLKTSPDTVPLSRRTQLILERKHTDVGRVAEMLAVVGADPNRDSMLRRTADALVQVMVRDYPIPNEAALLEKTRQHPPQP